MKNTDKVSSPVPEPAKNMKRVDAIIKTHVPLVARLYKEISKPTLKHKTKHTKVAKLQG